MFLFILYSVLGTNNYYFVVPSVVVTEVKYPFLDVSLQFPLYVDHHHCILDLVPDGLKT